ncbi:MAG: protein translocase subunit SecF [Candidatus Adiutrix sp.]|jgi:preprotein translocase subunit SecF|nr:protein translocase subunit SecF [Candidatus Adiutrix sp.]
MTLELINPGININFIGRRHLAFAVSGLFMLICLGSVAFKGLQMGVDFAGGLLIQAKFAQTTDPDQIRQAMSQAGLPSASNIQAFGEAGDNEFLINLQAGEDLETEAAAETSLSQEVRNSLFQHFGAENVDIRRVEMVGSKVGADLREKAMSALFYSILMILIYISGRFEHKWGTSAVMVGALLAVLYVASLLGASQIYLIILAVMVTLALCYFLKFEYALGAILALLHDVIFTLGVFSLLDKEITLSFVAALLTIAGYSLNDTIIIYDRIREHVSSSRKADYALTINKSINETLSRTVLTSGSTLLVIVALYLLGGPVNQDFALALLLGIGVGTLSSIFISAPALLFWTRAKSSGPTAGLPGPAA